MTSTGADRIAIPFNDLRRRARSIRSAVDARVREVLDSGNFILGERVESFERAFAAYCGVAHGVGVASGTEALWLTLEALGIGPGDEVITAGNTCAPTVAAIVQSGATPVLVDIDPVSFTIDPSRVAASVGPKTRCVIAVHLYGQCADMDALRDVCSRHDLYLVEDAAQAHGAEHGTQRAGAFGVAACFSFYPTKNLGAFGDAGIVVTDNSDLAHRVSLIRNYGYDEPNCSVRKGFNSRLDEIQAAILLAGLDRLDGWNQRRRDQAAAYTAAFSGTVIQSPPDPPNAKHVYHLYVVRVPDRDEFRRRLLEEGIQTSIHYPVPVHRQQGFADLCQIGHGGLSNSEAASCEIVSLPLFPELEDQELRRVIDASKRASES